ncbi:uncharacterized protein LOC131604301 [Vicia villosa]|uniref:uncharacterized protein LOC131604301 n=1 Tax=Vicia villosa TaxID=3911 RepID=UPI00273BDB50|nr:uncharacterized protein LOC131604301 [Vicia villosa]
MEMRRKQGGEEWRTVGGGSWRGRESAQWDILKNDTRGISWPVSTFFFLYFGVQWMAKDLFFEFKDLGLIEEIVIPSKKDWKGLRYGFFRYLNIEDERLVEIKMNNLLPDGRNINANISKFKRKDLKPSRDFGKRRNFGEANLRPNGGYVGAVGAGPSQVNYVEGGGQARSYMEAVRGNSFIKKYVEVETSKSLFFKSTDEERRGMEKVMVGISVTLGLAYEVGKSLIEEGIFTVKAIPLGPNLCLLEETMEGVLKALLEEGGDWKKKWFKEVRQWRPEDVECFRAAWVSVYGIPCHGKNRRFLESLVTDIGIIAHFGFLDLKPERFDVLSFMIFTHHLDPIRNKVNVCMDGSWVCMMVIEDVAVRNEC